MSISIIRSMDSQGRIVIPMEIRKQLHLLDGEALEIEAGESDIRLRKCIPYAAMKKELQDFLSVLHSAISCGIVICNRERILLSKGIFLPEGTSVTEDIRLLIDNGQERIFSSKDSIYPADTIHKRVAAIFPINQSTASGTIALLLCPKKGQYLGDMELSCARLVANVIARKFK